MSEFMTISEFKLLKVKEIKKLKALEIMSDGEWLFTAIIPHGDIFEKDSIRMPAEMLAVRANVIGGVDPSELKEKKLATV